MTSELVDRKIILRPEPEHGETVTEIERHPTFESMKRGLNSFGMTLVVEPPHDHDFIDIDIGGEG